MRVLAYLLTCGAAIIFAVFAVYARRMTNCSKDGRHLFRSEAGYNPFYSFYRPDLLSAEGRAYRIRAGYWFLAFVAASAITMLVWSRS
jgi:hypothetical protein